MPCNDPQQWEHASCGCAQVCELTEAVLTLTEQVRMLRQSLDELEQDVGWAIRTRVLDRLPPPSPTRVTSFPIDPLAEDFDEQLNKVRPENLPTSAMVEPTPTQPRRQARLW